MPDITQHTKEEQSTLLQLRNDSVEELMSLKIDPIGSLRMKYINELRERCNDLFSAYQYPEYITCDIELLRFLRGYMVIIFLNILISSLIWKKQLKLFVRC